MELFYDAFNAELACISVRGRQTQTRSEERVAEVLQNFPEAYISAVTDETSVTITVSRNKVAKLKKSLTAAGFLVQDVPVNGRFHNPAFAPEVEKLVSLFKGASDLRFPGPERLRVAVRSATDGKVINQGDLVRHILENTLLKPVEWYKTLELSTASLPPGPNCIALAGLSNCFPQSLCAKPDLRFLSLHGLTEDHAKTIQDNSINGLSGSHTPPHTPPGYTFGGRVLDWDNGHDGYSGTRRKPALPEFPPHSVAIVGMAGRFPGANSVDELWELISAGRSTVTSPPGRVGLDQLAEDNSQVRWWGNFIEDHDAFDHKFFNKSAREATACDPQQRKLLEVVYEALESSGYHSADSRVDPTDYGCYIGAVMNNYASNVSCHPPTAYATMGTSRAYFSGAISHHFGWTGPATTIDTACSSSLVAIHTACRAIAAGECSRAVAGGTNVITCPHDYRDLKAAGFLSPTGQCKPFDTGADGYCRGEAVGVVVLKSLDAAIEENDHILGVVVGSATNQNPKEGPIVVPNSKAQASLLRKVMEMSDVLPEDVTYVEAHGTGTGVGDPIEVQSLRDAFGGPSRTSTLHFSSIKGNIGHAEAASGAAGLIKTILMLRHEQIPPQASFGTLNPNIPALEPDGMAIPRKLMPWNPRDRVACVNNYGAAGSNSVVLIREAPSIKHDGAMPDIATTPPSKWPLILSAANKASLSTYGQKLLDWVRHARAAKSSDISITDILFNLAHRANHALEHIVAIPVSDISDLESTVSAIASGEGVLATSTSPPPPVVLVFGGQEGRFVGLSEPVYQSSQIFRQHLDTCQQVSLNLGLDGLYPAIFQQTPVSDLITLHTALFAVQYASAHSQVAQELRRVDSLIGHRRWEQITTHQDAEGMRGKHIYRAFGQVVEYSDAFKGIKTIACLGSEAAGTVSILPDLDDPPEQRQADTPMIDSFMQFGGFLVNYFNEAASPDSLFVCHHVQRVQFGPAFTPDGKDWFVWANMTSVDQGNLSADVYVSDTHSRKTVFTALGMIFGKISRASLTRMLCGSTARDVESLSALKARDRGPAARDEVVTPAGEKPPGNNMSKRAEIFRIAASITDIPENELSGEMPLVDIGVDSLGATEMVGDITSTLNVTIDLATFLLFPNINAIVAHVDSQLGLQPTMEEEAVASLPTEAAKEPQVSMSHGNMNEIAKVTKPKRDNALKSDHSTLPIIRSIQESFDDVRLNFDRLGTGAQALDYWSDIYPDDVRLVLAYTTEAFHKLGCELRNLRPTEPVPEVEGVLPRHRQLVRRLYQLLEDENVIERSASGDYVRTNKTIETTDDEQIFREIIDKHPLNGPIRHLLQAVGPHLAACLAGGEDARQILFGNRLNKKWLEQLYMEWPMLVTATKLLGDFLLHAFTKTSGPGPPSGPFRILEVGAGTGGTTRHLVDLLTRHGIQFEYCFTDISASLVQKAKTSFADVDGMTFAVLDVEQEPAAELADAFHVIISTNCIHATRNITHSLSNLRKMLREDGALALIEMTAPRPLYVFDVIVGLLEGWWLFEDGRSHALANVDFWARAFTDAGFREVLWSDGATLEAKTVRVLCGFRMTGAPWISQEMRTRNGGSGAGAGDVRIQEVVYKTVGSQEIHADIYCPSTVDSARKMPVALMIHGGSHVIFSRKDVRPPQTRIMLDMGLLPVSLDHRLCPETRLVDGPMVDVCEAVEWARTTLPHIELTNPDIKPDPDNVVVVGWSSGGQLALSTGWTTVERGLRPPNAILAFYCPTDYEDDWWQKPIQPIGAEDKGEDYDVLEAVQDEPITNYGIIGAWEPLSDPRIRSDPRARIVLHMNWKAQTLPVVIGGLPSRGLASRERPEIQDWNALTQPPIEEVRRCSPLAQVRSGSYATPTFMVHGTADDLIPWQQSFRTVEEMKTRGVDAQLVLVPEGPHVCDMSHDPESAGWKAVLEAYRWLEDHAFSHSRHS
ncbi:beta-ketoacyl synthase [Colletotrichum tabaci]|uniref:Beta-ketoacyl synthase n=1 Tax=Colletotrichum tabaci TaxID=1209068 RepID=A0AAV9TH73_9PEZI